MQPESRLASRWSGIGAFRERGRIELAHEGFPRGCQPCLQAAARPEDTVSAIVPEALDQRMTLLKRPHDLTQRDGLGRPRQAETAADAALGGDEAPVGEIAHHLGEVVTRNAKLGRDFVVVNERLGSPASRINARSPKSVKYVRRISSL